MITSEEFPRIVTLFADLVLDTVDEPIGKVSTQSLIKWYSKFLLKSLLEAPGVNVWSGMCTFFNDLIRGIASSLSIME
jgi:hypothetical protein